MSETTFVARSHIPAPAAAVLAWHAHPGAFERLTPPWMDVRVLTETGGIAPGASKRLRVGAGPLGFTWDLAHEAGTDGAGFVDVQVAGPFRAWRHEHRFLPDGAESSVLEDRIAYQLPFGRAGSLLAGRAVERRLDDLFRFRHHRTRTDLARHGAAGLDAPLRIAVTGASGLVGRQLVPFLRTGGHDVVSLVRRRPRTDDEIFWDPARGEIDAAALDGIDAVVHLAGESIAGGRWTAKRRQAILNSRVQGTGLLARTLAGLHRPPRVFVSASAIGYYGDAGTTALTEESPSGDGFLAGVCRVWEDAAIPAADAGIRVVHPRIAVVVAGDGGFLAQVGRLFQFGLGGPVGSGDQIMSWIARDDLLGIILQAIADERLRGPVNAASPNPVTNRAFAQTLGRLLDRPAFVRAPASALRLVAGGLADELLLASQSVQPARLAETGFRFAYPIMEDALRHELGRYEGMPDADALRATPAPVVRLGRWQ
jgi:uncharacterized protein (TIGR01777 family)